MWFEHAQGKEKIQFMFNGEISLADVEFENFLFYTHSSLRLVFHSRNIPKDIPAKWGKTQFNSIVITLEFSDILSFKSEGSNLGFICTPAIESLENQSTILVEHKDFYLSCKSSFLFIGDIVPFLDQRWK